MGVVSNATPITEPRPGAGRRDGGENEPRRGPRWGMIALRYVLPTVIVLAGIAMMAGGTENDLEGGAGVVSAGLAIFLINVLFRIGAVGDRDREQEDAAREYFDRHGRWPD